VIFFKSRVAATLQRVSPMWHWHCIVDVSYPRLSDCTRLQWALHS